MSDWMDETGGLRTCLVNRWLNRESPCPASGSGRGARECEHRQVRRVTGREPATPYSATIPTFSLRVRRSRRLSSRGFGSPGTSGQRIMGPLRSRSPGRASRCKGTRTPDVALAGSQGHRGMAQGPRHDP